VWQDQTERVQFCSVGGVREDFVAIGHKFVCNECVWPGHGPCRLGYCVRVDSAGRGSVNACEGVERGPGKQDLGRSATCCMYSDPVSGLRCHAGVERIAVRAQVTRAQGANGRGRGRGGGGWVLPTMTDARKPVVQISICHGGPRLSRIGCQGGKGRARYINDAPALRPPAPVRWTNPARGLGPACGRRRAPSGGARPTTLRRPRLPPLKEGPNARDHEACHTTRLEPRFPRFR